MGEKPREAIINNLKRKATETIENIADRMNQSDSYIRKREKSNSNKIIKTKKKNHYREKINWKVLDPKNLKIFSNSNFF